MPITLRYIGTQNPWFESAVTGRPGKWTPGDSGDVADADVALLLATALFEVAGETVLPFSFDVSGAIIGGRRPDGSVAALRGSGGAVAQTAAITGTALAYTGPGYFAGITVTAYSGGPQTVTVRDSLDASGAVLGVFTVSGTGIYELGTGLRIAMDVGLHITISGGTSRTLSALIEGF